MPKLSVIIPVYNCEKYLHKCLDSLINQTLKDIEIICVNDGSTDNSAEIIKTYSNVKLINKENGGQSSARNKGLEIAQGEYIGFVDSDDWIDLNYFETLYNTAKKYNADIAMSDFIRTGPNKNKIRLNISSEQLYYSTEDKIKISNALKEGCIWNKIYKKEILNNIRFNEGMYFEDGPFTIRTLHASNKLVTVPNVFYYYFQNPCSTVKTMNKQKYLDKQKSKREILDFFKQHNINIKDRTYWANLKKYILFGINYATIQESIKSKRVLLFNIIPLG